MSLLASALVAHMPVALLGFNLEDILISTGPWVLVVSAIIVFIESGVLFPVLPGDSLIFALGMLHDRMELPLLLVFPVLVVAAVAGGEVGYQLGARYGRNLFKDDAKFLSTKNLHAAEEFFAKRGGVALVLGLSCRLCARSCRWRPVFLRTRAVSLICGIFWVRCYGSA